MTAGAQAPTPTFLPGPSVSVIGTGVDSFTSVGVFNGPTIQAVPASTITVTYTGFGSNPAAQAAFQAAIDVWASKLTSSVVIKINADWTALGPGVLGQAGPTNLVANFSGAPQANTYYPIALAEAIAGTNLNGSTAEISASFSSSFSNWYFGTDGATPSGKYDFESVVMHEVGHGLGMIGFYSYSGGTGSYQVLSPFDRYIVNGANQVLASTYANNSTALGSQLVSNNLFVNGTNAMSANGGAKPKLYDPATWSGGSSVYHLDDATYPPGNANSLMTSAIGTAEAIHDPGPITLGSFRDIGWTIAGGGGGPPPATQLAFTSAPGSSTVGVPFGTQPVVAVRAADNSTVTTDNATVVTLAINSGPVGGVLTCSGGLSKTAVAGVASFSGCAANVAGTYTLKATATGLTQATTGAFALTAAPATKLGFTAAPSGGGAGSAFPTQPTVAVQTAAGATVTTDNATVVTLAVASGPGALTCTGGLAKTVAAGVASFSGCAVNVPGTYTLRATATALTQATTASFAIAGAPGSPPAKPTYVTATTDTA
ncbi:MAG: hypothetical protein HYX53_08165, partial [Chloroflexi bacterium]|nr:hypothetical protein [Chloroflexota bacterium]